MRWTEGVWLGEVALLGVWSGEVALLGGLENGRGREEGGVFEC